MISRGPCQPQLFCDSAEKNLGRGIMNLDLSLDRRAIVISETTCAGPCCDMPVSIAFLQGTAGVSKHTFPHPAVYLTVFLHCTSPPEHQRISFHDQCHRLKLWPHVYKLVLNTRRNFHLISPQCLSSSYPSVRVSKNQELQLPKM